MIKKFVLLTAFAAMSTCFCVPAQAQYGGVQVRIGGYAPGVSWGGYGNGFNNNYNGYGNNYYNGFGNNYRYGNGYQLGYRNYSQPSAAYYSGGNYGGFRYSSYPTVTYGVVAPRYYSTPVGRIVARRFR